MSTVAPLAFPTGKEVLVELQKYRRDNGLPEFILYQPLCNNIGERWQNYRSTNSHKGLEEFHWREMPQIVDLAEILAPGATAQEVVENWAASPSHDLYIKSNARICVYSADGLSVALLSN